MEERVIDVGPRDGGEDDGARVSAVQDGRGAALSPVHLAQRAARRGRSALQNARVQPRQTHQRSGDDAETLSSTGGAPTPLLRWTQGRGPSGGVRRTLRSAVGKRVGLGTVLVCRLLRHQTSNAVIQGFIEEQQFYPRTRCKYVNHDLLVCYNHSFTLRSLYASEEFCKSESCCFVSVTIQVQILSLFHYLRCALF